MITKGEYSCWGVIGARGSSEIKLLYVGLELHSATQQLALYAGLGYNSLKVIELKGGSTNEKDI